jgi:hypothetical protein
MKRGRERAFPLSVSVHVEGERITFVEDGKKQMVAV